MGSAGTALFHLSALGFYLYVWRFQLKQLKVMESSKEVEIVVMRKFALRYLTKWTYAMQTIYLAMCVIQHFLNLISANQLRDKLTRYSDYLFTSISTPMALMVTLVFWTVFIYDRRLIFPKVLDKVVPLWINHSIHTLNSVFAIMDVFFVKHRFPTWTKAINGMAGYFTIYGICLFGTYFQTGIWIYPIFSKLNWPQRILFSLATLSIGISLYGVTKLLHLIIWGSATATSEKIKLNKY